MFYVVPDYLSDRLNELLDEEISKCPDATKDRDHLYKQLLSYVNKYGTIPNFSLAPARRPTGAE